MKNIINKGFLVFTVLLFTTPVFAKNIELEKARKNIAKLYKDINPKNITPSPIPGLYQVAMPPRFFYISLDGRYLVSGDLIDTMSKQNISQTPRNKSVAAAINSISEDSMIIFGKKSLKHTITVFTDIDCSYCRKLHHEMDKYNELGIRVRYMAYPRAGIDSASFNKIEAVWCSKDKAKAMTRAKNRQYVKSVKCNSPVRQHLALVYLLGLSGTPAIILEDGSIIPGYVPASRLIRIINKSKKK